MIAGILLTISACQPVLSATPASSAIPMLYRDDFSNPDSGWTSNGNLPNIASVADGVFRIRVDQPNTDAWSTPGLQLNDVRVEVDAIKVAGDRNNRFGLLCRMNAPSRFYVFLISSDGYYGIGKIDGNSYRLLGSESMLPSDKIPKGSAYLRLRADCLKDRLLFYVNGEKIAEARDSAYTGGDVGIIAGAYNTPGTEILFDNFTVYKP